ncbi:hypothetical protein FRB91_008094 [Serendipita sp. 411]|nr:hypothetical protein FRB91_008094 [Serendipita sp. 411]
MATGTKCLPVTKYSKAGDVVHDFHAEVVARRAAVRWFLSEIAKPSSEWLERSTDLSQTQGRNSTLGLRPGVKLHMYISELPCGAASMNTLAYLQTVRDPEMANLKSKSDLYASPDGAARGRNGYELSDIVRTKPGKGDSPRTNAMSCSDKIALWSVVGIQGALAVSLGLHPIYIDTITIGSVKGTGLLGTREDSILRDCQQALSGRLGGCSFHEYEVNSPNIVFTAAEFDDGKRQAELDEKISSNEALCWIADQSDGIAKEILVNGTRRGVLPKNRALPLSRPRICKAALFSQYRQTAIALKTLNASSSSESPATALRYSDVEETNRVTVSDEHRIGWASYHEAKHGPGTEAYHAAKQRLRGIGGYLHGWVICDTEFETFGLT